MSPDRRGDGDDSEGLGLGTIGEEGAGLYDSDADEDNADWVADRLASNVGATFGEWRYRVGASDADVHGPFDSTQMATWARAGYFHEVSLWLQHRKDGAEMDATNDAAPNAGFQRCDGTEAVLSFLRAKRKPNPFYGASSAILSCPCCFVTLCVDCQQHVRYKSQFRPCLCRIAVWI